MSNATAVLDQVMEVPPPPQEMSAPTILAGIRRAERASAGLVSRTAVERLGAVFGAADAEPQGSGVALLHVKRSISRLTLVAGRLDEHRARRNSRAFRLLSSVAGTARFCRRPAAASAIPLPNELQQAGVIFQPLERGADRTRRAFPQTFHGASRRRSAPRSSPRCTQPFVARALFSTCPAAWRSNCRSRSSIGCTARTPPFSRTRFSIAEELSKVTVVEHFRSTDRDAARLRLRRQRSHRRRGREGHLRLRAELEPTKSLSLQINATTVDRDAPPEPERPSWRRLFALRKPEPPDRRGRAQRHACRHRRRRRAGIRCPHAAGSRFAAHHERSALQEFAQRRARTIFGGLIRVEPHAHHTDAYQKVRNLLLSDDAEANSMPGLEILADNVRCTHGATSGQVDEDELFLSARPRHPAAGRATVARLRLPQRSPRAPARPRFGRKTRALIADKFAQRAR